MLECTVEVLSRSASILIPYAEPDEAALSTEIGAGSGDCGDADADAEDDADSSSSKSE